MVLEVDTRAVTPATWAEQPPQAGDVVFALSRGGHRIRISFGMVSSVDVAFHGPRRRKVHGGVEHTAPLVRGSSGRPVADADGRVVGLNTHRTGRGFYVARPIDAALRSTIDDLAAGKSVVRPRLGVALATPEVAAKLRASVGLPPRDGLLVRGVEPEGPAANAGIAEGDLLVAVGGTPLVSIETLHDAGRCRRDADIDRRSRQRRADGGVDLQSRLIRPKPLRSARTNSRGRSGRRTP